MYRNSVYIGSVFRIQSNIYDSRRSSFLMSFSKSVFNKFVLIIFQVYGVYMRFHFGRNETFSILCLVNHLKLFIYNNTN